MLRPLRGNETVFLKRDSCFAKILPYNCCFEKVVGVRNSAVCLGFRVLLLCDS